jgi:two-component system response regulator DevR
MPHDLRCVLLLEPEVWRFSGISGFLNENGIAVADRIGASTSPGATMVARRLLASCGTAIVERIRRDHPDAPILVHGDAEPVETIASILAAGVQGYFVLSGPRARLLDALRVIREGDLWAPRTAVALLARPPGSIEEDTGSDAVVLSLLLEGLSNKEIAARLGMAEVTVKSRLTRLYKKYGVRTRLELVTCVVKQRATSVA